jgi:predicted  nucleic acid-binding Zn-ribbon protein
MLDGETEAEVVIDESALMVGGEVDVKRLQSEFITCCRTVAALKQEMQQLRNQVQRNLTTLKQVEARVARR